MATSFQSDASGFLVGELVKSNRDLQSTQYASYHVLRALRSDVRAIGRQLGAQMGRYTRESRPGAQAAASRSSSGSRAADGAGTAGQRGAAARSSGAGSARAAAPGGRGSARAAGSASASTSSTGNTGQTAGARRASGPQPIGSSAGSTPATRDAKGRFVKAGEAASPVSPAGRDSGGRFVGRGGNGGDGGNAEMSTAGAIGRLSDAVQGLGNTLGRAEQIDPTIAAAKEISDVVSPLGRGMAMMFGRNAERKKERWYQRLLKALAPKRGDPVQGGGMAGGAAVREGSLIGTFLGEFMGRMAMPIMRVLGAVFMRVLAPVAAVWASWNVGKWIGEKIYDWLDKSGVMTKVFDAFDSIKDTFNSALSAIPQKVSEVLGAIDAALRKIPLIGDAYGKAVDTIKGAASEVKKGFEEVGNGNAPKSTLQAVGGAAAGAVQGAKNIAAQAKAGYEGSTDAPAASGMLQRIARGAGKLASAAPNAALMLQAGRDAGMGTKELANFMGQNAHESVGFTTLSENLNYSAQGLRKTFGKYYKTDAEAQADANNPQAIANRVYGGRMGNTEPGDGYKFRGRGFTQLTGKDNYAAAGKALGLDLVNSPDLAADPKNAAKISAWYWKNRVSSKGAGEDVTAATKLVNGGTIGLEDRKKKAAEWEAKIAAGTESPVTAGGLSLARSSASAQVASASMAMQGLPSASVPPSIPANLPSPVEAQAPPQKLSSGSGDRQAVVVRLPDTVGQNVADRSLAHIATGGIGGA